MSEHDYLILDVNRGGLCCGSLAFSLCLSKILDTYRTTPRGFHQVNLYHLSSRKKKNGWDMTAQPTKDISAAGLKETFQSCCHALTWSPLANAHKCSLTCSFRQVNEVSESRIFLSTTVWNCSSQRAGWGLSTGLTRPCLICVTWHFEQDLNTTLCKSNQQNKPCLKHASWTLAAKEGSLESTYMILNTTCLTWPVFKTVCLNLLANTFPNIVCFCSLDRLLFSNSPFWHSCYLLIFRKPCNTESLQSIYLFFHTRSYVEDSGFIYLFFWRGFWLCYKPWPDLITNTFLHVFRWPSSAFKWITKLPLTDWKKLGFMKLKFIYFAKQRNKISFPKSS